MLLYVTIALALLALRIVALSRRPRATPSHCRCGRPADVFDHARPWIVWCGKCWLKKERSL